MWATGFSTSQVGSRILATLGMEGLRGWPCYSELGKWGVAAAPLWKAPQLNVVAMILGVIPGTPAPQAVLYLTPAGLSMGPRATVQSAHPCVHTGRRTWLRTPPPVSLAQLTTPNASPSFPLHSDTWCISFQAFLILRREQNSG